MNTMMTTSEFVGWVEKILEPSQYGREFTVRDYRDDADPNKPKYPNVLKFRLSTKIQSMLDGVAEGDKIRVKYFTTGRSGYGQKGYYCIVNLNVAKDGGITMIEMAPRGESSGSEEAQEEPVDDGLPF